MEQVQELAEHAIGQLRKLAETAGQLPDDTPVLDAATTERLAATTANGLEHWVERALAAERAHRALLEELGRT